MKNDQSSNSVQIIAASKKWSDKSIKIINLSLLYYFFICYFLFLVFAFEPLLFSYVAKYLIRLFSFSGLPNVEVRYAELNSYDGLSSAAYISSIISSITVGLFCLTQLLLHYRKNKFLQNHRTKLTFDSIGRLIYSTFGLSLLCWVIFFSNVELRKDQYIGMAFIFTWVFSPMMGLVGFVTIAFLGLNWMATVWNVISQTRGTRHGDEN